MIELEPGGWSKDKDPWIEIGPSGGFRALSRAGLVMTKCRHQ